MGDLALFISSKAQPGKRDEIYQLYQTIMAPRAEANERQEVVVWCADQHDPDGFHLFEVYTDAEAFGANAQSEFFQEFMQASGPMLAGEPTVAMCSPRWSKGL
ncbi:MAG: antibiotic biosynthesis monooxygenase [Actinomycetota bacterium]